MKKELTDLELEKVNAGWDGFEEQYVIGNHFYNGISKYDGVVGKEYWVWQIQHYNFFRGVLIETWESDRCFGASLRRHKFRVTDEGHGAGVYVGDIKDVSGDEWFLFENADIVNRSLF